MSKFSKMGLSLRLLTSARNHRHFLTPTPTPQKSGPAPDFVPVAFLSGAWHQEVGWLLNQAEVNMPSEEKAGNIPQIVRSTCRGVQPAREQGYTLALDSKIQAQLR